MTTYDNPSDYPTLTSNTATLGWGTLGVLIGSGSVLTGGGWAGHPPGTRAVGVEQLPQLRVGRARQSEAQRLAACGVEDGPGSLVRAEPRARLGPPLQKTQGWATLGLWWLAQSPTSHGKDAPPALGSWWLAHGPTSHGKDAPPARI
jgi:hypothetical protein